MRVLVPFIVLCLCTGGTRLGAAEPSSAIPYRAGSGELSFRPLAGDALKPWTNSNDAFPSAPAALALTALDVIAAPRSGRVRFAGKRGLEAPGPAGTRLVLRPMKGGVLFSLSVNPETLHLK